MTCDIQSHAWLTHNFEINLCNIFSYIAENGIKESMHLYMDEIKCISRKQICYNCLSAPLYYATHRPSHIISPPPSKLFSFLLFSFKDSNSCRLSSLNFHCLCRFVTFMGFLTFTKGLYTSSECSRRDYFVVYA